MPDPEFGSEAYFHRIAGHLACAFRDDSPGQDEILRQVAADALRWAADNIDPWEKGQDAHIRAKADEIEKGSQ